MANIYIYTFIYITYITTTRFAGPVLLRRLPGSPGLGRCARFFGWSIAKWDWYQEQWWKVVNWIGICWGFAGDLLGTMWDVGIQDSGDIYYRIYRYTTLSLLWIIHLGIICKFALHWTPMHYPTRHDTTKRYDTPLHHITPIPCYTRPYYTTL